MTLIRQKIRQKDPKEKKKKKRKYVWTDGQTDGHTERLQNRPRRLTSQNVRSAGPVLPMN